jgi:hypothetical protein
MTSTLLKGTPGSVASLIAATLHQGNPEIWHWKFRSCLGTGTKRLLCGCFLGGKCNYQQNIAMVNFAFTLRQIRQNSLIIAIAARIESTYNVITHKSLDNII